VRVASWERFGIDSKRMLLFALLCGASAWLVVRQITVALLADNSTALSMLISSIVFYLVLSFPKHRLEAAALAQSKEIPAVAVMGSAGLDATRSIAKSFLMLRSDEPEISKVLRHIRRAVLLGHKPSEILKRPELSLASYSAMNVLCSIASPDAGGVFEGGEEALGLMQSAQLGEESKVPLFTAVAFFAPMMLILYSIMSHKTDPTSLAEIVGLQVALIDVAYYFSSIERKRLR